MNKQIIFVISLFIIVWLNDGVAGELPQTCSQNCEVGFGEVLGISPAGIEAYSNCNNQCVNPAPNFVNQIFTGIKWQCVEYARRWLLQNYGLIYGDVDVAADIWQLTHTHTPDGKNHSLFKNVLNGDQHHRIQRGDLLIYARSFLGTGHVAVVLNVDAEKQLVYLGEQNFDNNKWQGEAARVISYVIHNQGIWLLDPYLIGWKRVISDEIQDAESKL